MYDRSCISMDYHIRSSRPTSLPIIQHKLLSANEQNQGRIQGRQTHRCVQEKWRAGLHQPDFASPQRMAPIGSGAGRQNGSSSLNAVTMSNPRLPPEILDHTIDLLHDEQETLEDCCLVAKSWVPRTRKHLFAHVRFADDNCLKSWKKAFPNPSNSPAYHTRSLAAGCDVTEADAEEGGWIPTFSRLVRLELDCPASYGKRENLVPFRKFSPTLKSLYVDSILLVGSQLFGLICFLPLLEDLVLAGRTASVDDEDDLQRPQTAVPLPSPVLSGLLDLSMRDGMGNIARRLLDLPGGFHFRKLVLPWYYVEDLRWIMGLVMGCPDTLECLDVACYPGTFGLGPTLEL